MSAGRADIGLDFGMTNSLLSVYDPQAGPKPFIAEGMESVGVPTVVDDPDKSLAERLWGIVARCLDVHFANFKTALPRTGVMTPAQRESNKEFRAARAFIESLFHDFKRNGGYKGIGELVVTVPETWERAGEQSGRDAVFHIFESLRLPKPRLISEPVAAGCYFAHLHHQRTGQWFDGHVLVYDHGGGTLDLAVLRIKGHEVRVIDGVGLSREHADRGFGGVEFDRQVFESVAKRVPKVAKIRINGQEGKEWLAEFELKKRQMSQHIEKRCTSPHFEANKDSPVFSVKGTDVLLRDLTDTFDNSFAKPIEKSIMDLLAKVRTTDGIKPDNPDRFRVVCVGGFSEFYPVQRLIATVFNRETGNPEITNSGLSREHKWLAISKGACLVAAGKIEIAATCPYTFGVVSYKGGKRTPLDLMKLGQPLSDYSDPKFLDARFGLAQSEFGSGTSIEFYIVQAGRQIPLPMRTTFNKALPDFGKADRWLLGCQVVDGTVMVQIKSIVAGKESTSRIVRMGKLLSLVNGHLDEIFGD